MFPLGTVLVPGRGLALHVFEPRYRALVETCVAGDGCFGVVLIERGSEVGGADVRFDIGTVARINEVARSPDGRYAVAAVGTDRFRVVQWLADDPFPRAEIEVLAEPDANAATLARRAAVVEGFRRVLDAARSAGAEISADLVSADLVSADRVLADDPIQAGWDAISLAPIGPLDALAILREDDPVARLDQVVAALAAAAELLELRHG